jgi:general secretion pathway protein C
MRFRSPAGNGRWTSHLAATVLFAALCGIATFWALQLLAPRMAIAPAGSIVDWQRAPDLAAASRLFGLVPQAGQARQVAAVASNISVVGIAASPHRGSAILSVDGGPAKAILAGDPIDDNAWLIEVRADAVIIEQAGARVELPTPARPDPALLSAGPAAAAMSAATTSTSSVPGARNMAGRSAAATPAARPMPPGPPPAAQPSFESQGAALPQLSPGIRQ